MSSLRIKSIVNTDLTGPLRKNEVKTVWFELEVGETGAEEADLFQVGVQVGMRKGANGALPKGVALTASDEAAAKQLVVNLVEACDCENWEGGLEYLKGKGFQWEYEGLK